MHITERKKHYFIKNRNTRRFGSNLLLLSLCFWNKHKQYSVSYFETYEEMCRQCYQYKNKLTNKFIEYDKFILLKNEEQNNYRQVNSKYKLVIYRYEHKKIIDDMLEKCLNPNFTI